MSEGSKELTQEICADHAEAMLKVLSDHHEMDYAPTALTLEYGLNVLRHYAAVHRLDFIHALRGAEESYRAERP